MKNDWHYHGHNILTKIKGMKSQDILLMCGELSAQEMRTAKALLNWFSTELKYCRK